VFSRRPIGQVCWRSPHIADHCHAIRQKERGFTPIPEVDVHVRQARHQKLAGPVQDLHVVGGYLSRRCDLDDGAALDDHGLGWLGM
jgi:hypothetical protein